MDNISLIITCIWNKIKLQIKKRGFIMLDIRLIRENPEKINELLKRRNPDL